MQIDIQTHGLPLTEELRAYTERRLRYALSWAESRIRRIEVRCVDENGPRGGVSNRCTLYLRLSRSDDIIIKDIQTDIYTAIERAADRANRTLARQMQRRRGVHSAGYQYPEAF